MFFIRIFLLAVSLFAFPAFAQDSQLPTQSFDDWLVDFRKAAMAQGISPETLDDAFADTQPLERVVALDQKQPEGIVTLAKYLQNTVTPGRVNDGRAYYEEYRELLTKIGKKYGVQPKFILALWGIETGYGSGLGGFRTIDALATLAYEGRRREFFSGELLSALRILQDERMPADGMLGSWAGALGQCQFMPSSFLKYAVDYDGNGHRDIWNSQEDVFASIANYLHVLGWNDEEGWGEPVSLPEGFAMELADITQEKSLNEWHRLGVRNVDGSALSGGSKKTSLALVGKDEDAAPYLVNGNYKALLKWNRSRFFATAVGTLADRIEP